MSIVLDGTNGITTNAGTLLSATTIGVGGTTPSASGAGVSFPATQSASSDANTLDDYEEGTWTPADGSGAGLSFANIQAQYTKIGRMVFASATFDFPSTASTATNSISGLPFTVGTTSGYIGGFITNGNVAVAVRFRPGNNSSTGSIRDGSGTAQTNVALSSGAFTINAVYMV